MNKPSTKCTTTIFQLLDPGHRIWAPSLQNGYLFWRQQDEPSHAREISMICLPVSSAGSTPENIKIPETTQKGYKRRSPPDMQIVQVQKRTFYLIFF